MSEFERREHECLKSRQKGEKLALGECRCEWCGYIAADVKFLEGSCPACCRDNDTGEKERNSVPQVYHYPDMDTKEWHEHQKIVW